MEKKEVVVAFSFEAAFELQVTTVLSCTWPALCRHLLSDDTWSKAKGRLALKS